VELKRENGQYGIWYKQSGFVLDEVRALRPKARYVTDEIEFLLDGPEVGSSATEIVAKRIEAFSKLVFASSIDGGIYAEWRHAFVEFNILRILRELASKL